MTTPIASSTIVVALLLAPAFAGCADLGSSDSPTAGGAEPTFGVALTVPPGHRVLAEYVMRVRPGERTARVERLAAPRVPGASAPGSNPESVSNLSVFNDGVPGSGPTDTVELVTGTLVISPPLFTADVTVRSFYERTLNNAYVQITAVQDPLGNDVSATHGGMSVDADPAAPATSILGGQPNLGLWRYPQSGFLAAGAGVSASAPGNAATRTWSFKNPDNAVTNIYFRVVASLTYKDYTRTSPSPQPFLDACAASGASNLGKPVGNNQATIPFPFTFYNQAPTSGQMTVKLNRDGIAAFAGATPPAPASFPSNSSNVVTVLSAGLPDAAIKDQTAPGTSPLPAMFAFWDQILFNPGMAALCYASAGAAPDRKFVMTWSDLRGISNANNTDRLNFSAILAEGNDTIDFVYSSMTSQAGTDASYKDPPSHSITYAQRASGQRAIVGLQGFSGGALVASPGAAVPGGADTSTGKSYRFTPVP